MCPEQLEWGLSQKMLPVCGICSCCAAMSGGSRRGSAPSLLEIRRVRVGGYLVVGSHPLRGKGEREWGKVYGRGCRIQSKFKITQPLPPLKGLPNCIVLVVKMTKPTAAKTILRVPRKIPLLCLTLNSERNHKLS